MVDPKHHVELPGETEIVTSFAVEVHKAPGVKQIKVNRTRINTILTQCRKVRSSLSAITMQIFGRRRLEHKSR